MPSLCFPAEAFTCGQIEAEVAGLDGEKQSIGERGLEWRAKETYMTRVMNSPDTMRHTQVDNSTKNFE